MTQDRTDESEPLWGMLWQLEDVASALHEQVDGLLGADEDVHGSLVEQPVARPPKLPSQAYYTERYGLGYDDEPHQVRPAAELEPWESSPLADAFHAEDLHEEALHEEALHEEALHDVDERISSLAERLGLDDDGGADADVNAHRRTEDETAEPTRRANPASFRKRLQRQEPVDNEHPGRVTSAFHNVVYGIEEPIERESLRVLLERRAFDELWVQGSDEGSDQFIEFFAAEGFGEPSS